MTEAQDTAPGGPGAGGQGLAGLRQGAPVLDGDGARLWDLGDGIACFEVRTKMNVLQPGVLDLLDRVLNEVPARFRGLVIGNDDPRAFSVGADLGYILGLVEAGDFDGFEAYVSRGQALFLALRYAGFPVVAAMHGFALGGGCELGLHANAIVAHAELAIGLPEVSVGLIPAWGGCTQMLRRQAEAGKDPEAAARAAFETIRAGRPSGSAAAARGRGLLAPGDAVVTARAALVPAAKDRALALADGYRPPERARILRPGPALRDVLRDEARGGTESGAEDLVLAGALAEVLCGAAPGAVDEAELMAEERETLLRLSRSATTRARMAHMLRTGKPLET